MNLAIWANLFWKEWREHQWKLAALTAILFGTFFCIWGIDWNEGALSASFVILFFYTPLASLFIGMGLAAGEQASGTIDRLRSLPLDTRWAASVKLLVGCLTVSLPGLTLIALTAVIVQLGWEDAPTGGIFRAFGTATWWFEVASLFVLSCVSLLIWIAATGVNQATELRAGAFGLIVVVLLWSVFSMTASVMHPGYDPEDTAPLQRYEAFLSLLAAFLPGGITIAMEVLPSATITRKVVTFSLLTLCHASLAAWFVFRFGQVASAKRRVLGTTGQPSGAGSWLRPPRRGRVEAILWKQFREAGPIIVGVLALAVGWTLFVLVDDRPHRLMDWVEVFTFVTTMCGFLAALLVGIGGFQDDLDPGTSTFWRSRPITPRLFYWLKYAGGLGMLALVFGGVFLFAHQTGVNEFDYSTRYVALGVILFWFTYATAVCLACLVRNAIYAGILAVLPAGYGAMVAFQEEYPMPIWGRIVLLVLAAVSVTMIGWLAMRHDWSIGR